MGKILYIFENIINNTPVVSFYQFMWEVLEGPMLIASISIQRYTTLKHEHALYLKPLRSIVLMLYKFKF